MGKLTEGNFCVFECQKTNFIIDLSRMQKSGISVSVIGNILELFISEIL